MRPLELVVEPYGDLVAGHPYPARVLDVKVKRKLIEMLVTLELINPEQEGRQLTCSLSAKLLPHNLTSQFLGATGQDVSPGRKVNPADAVGAQVLVTFASPVGNRDVKPVSFSPLKEKTNDDRTE